MTQPPKRPLKTVGKPRIRDMGGADEIYKKAILGDPNDYDTGQAQAWMERFGGVPGNPRSWEFDERARQMPHETKAFRAWEDTLNTILPRAQGFPRRARVSNLDFEGGGGRMAGGLTRGATSRGKIEVAGNETWDQRPTLAHEQYHARDASKDPFDPELHEAVSDLYGDPAVRRELQNRTPIAMGNTEEYRATLFGLGSRALGQLMKEEDPLAYMQKLERARPLQGRAMLAIAEQSPYHKEAAAILRKMGFTPPAPKRGR